MIRTITGTVTELMTDGMVVETAGVGYLVAVPARSVPALGAQVRVYTHHHVREDDEALYGFATPDELSLFEALLTVPSIGPKLALAILSAASPAELVSAVESDNLGFFQALPGLGKKSAAKIIVELKGKITSAGQTTIPGQGSELLEALVALGYRPSEVQALLGHVPDDLVSTQAQVTWALRQLGQPTHA